ncbi:MAG: prepilin-type N-terminal cleavage/methylation domain-containing protein [Candidatus Omnitrophota bacterium]|nr:prepilin-type N-terminal cleavage/methylation domain-containing protein [Candidatus Omnitrophota bacterium]MDZ4242720.1 prepilin-type N-terminal cleavage/methylation domain-containing protein [Candidatus Omnitrophota bacterium]
MRHLHRKRKGGGFTLVELMVTVGIVVTVIVILLQLFVYNSLLAGLAGNMSYAMSEAQAKMEEIRNSDYSQITTSYASGGTPGNTFDLSLATGKGIIYIDSSTADLLQVDVVVCWRGKDGRVIGEDKNLNGTLDTGEDADGDGKIGSSATLSTMIARMP